MIKFGASFGFAVMGRISLLIGRFEDLINYSSDKFNYATPVSNMYDYGIRMLVFYLMKRLKIKQRKNL